MSIVSTAYDNLVALITASLPNYFRLVNKDDEGENLDIFLRQGWCLIVDDEIDTKRHVSNLTSRSRKYRLVLSNEFFGLDGDHATQDLSLKALLEDCETVSNAIYLDPNLGGIDNLVIKTDTTSGIEFADKDNRKFILSTIYIEIERFNQL